MAPIPENRGVPLSRMSEEQKAYIDPDFEKNKAAFFAGYTPSTHQRTNQRRFQEHLERGPVERGQE